ncbi:hypothetical protein GCM10010389_37180 [Streptomyces echinoruber]|uniref:Uncharacterized protein n=1 Tax=Streptomyces echinoruber TaxID=68898 RepID=A0A918RDZ0_9ACTN|nr:hypothetical protein GCM10010389_37180 [Streptomyces echinoruber]
MQRLLQPRARGGQTRLAHGGLGEVPQGAVEDEPRARTPVSRAAVVDVGHRADAGARAAAHRLQCPGRPLQGRAGRRRVPAQGLLQGAAGHVLDDGGVHREVGTGRGGEQRARGADAEGGQAGLGRGEQGQAKGVREGVARVGGAGGAGVPVVLLRRPDVGDGRRAVVPSSHVSR